jgi:hypothetical protein
MWQRTMSKWTLAGNDRFTFNDIQMTWAHHNKQAQSSSTPADDAIDGHPQFDAVVRAEAAEMAQRLSPVVGQNASPQVWLVLKRRGLSISPVSHCWNVARRPS